MLLALWQGAQIVPIAAITLQTAMVGMRSIDSRDHVVLPTNDESPCSKPSPCARPPERGRGNIV
jgi:hypothetical protein